MYGCPQSPKVRGGRSFRAPSARQAWGDAFATPRLRAASVQTDPGPQRRRAITTMGHKKTPPGLRRAQAAYRYNLFTSAGGPLDDAAGWNIAVSADIQLHRQNEGAHHEDTRNSNHQPFDQRHGPTIKKEAPPCDGAPWPALPQFEIIFCRCDPARGAWRLRLGPRTWQHGSAAGRELSDSRTSALCGEGARPRFGIRQEFEGPA